MMYRKVFVIAGHHSRDSGAISDNIKESDLTKKVRDGIKYFLNKHYPDIEVVTDNDNHNLSQVIKWIKETEGNNSIIVDLHWNSASPKATGVEVFISDKASQTSKDLAKELLDVIVKISGLPSRGVKTESQSNRGRLGILNTKSPAVLIEMGFISNFKDRDAIDKYDGWIYEDLAHIIAKYAKKK